MSRRLRIAAVVGFAAVVAVVVYLLVAHRAPAGQPPLAMLDAGSMAALRTDFNAAAGEVRVIVLLSPT
jgi:anti-sigma-K factor RskA